MKKEIKRLVGEIVFLICLLAIIVPLFNNIQQDKLKTTEAMLANSSKLTIGGDLLDNGSLIPMTDEYAIDNLKESILTIKNVTNENISYNLILRIDKKSTLNSDSFKIKINDKITYLTENYNYEDNDYYYYIVYTSNISQKEEKVTFLIWLKAELETLNSGSISYSFIVEENNTLVYK